MIFTGDYCQCFDVVFFDTGKTYYKWYILKIQKPQCRSKYYKKKDKTTEKLEHHELPQKWVTFKNKPLLILVKPKECSF